MIQKDEPAAGWRSILKVHPAAELFPMLDEAELKALGEDILANGMTAPIVLWFPGPSRPTYRICDCVLLDGRNRLDALESVGIKIKTGSRLLAVDGKDKAANGRSILFEQCLVGASVSDPYAYVISANIHRRHLTTAQKSELIEALLRANPERSDRATAKLAKVSHVTVAAKREDLEATGQIVQLSKRTGMDGKARAAAKAKPAKPAPYVPPAPAWDGAAKTQPTVKQKTPEARDRLEKAAATGMVTDAEIIEETTVVNGEASAPLPLNEPAPVEPNAEPVRSVFDELAAMPFEAVLGAFAGWFNTLDAARQTVVMAAFHVARSPEPEPEPATESPPVAPTPTPEPIEFDEDAAALTVVRGHFASGGLPLTQSAWRAKLKEARISHYALGRLFAAGALVPTEEDSASYGPGRSDGARDPCKWQADPPQSDKGRKAKRRPHWARAP